LSEQLRIGVVGCGRMGGFHIRNYAQLDCAQLVAVADPSEESRRRALGDTRVAEYDNWHEMIEFGAEGLDAVSIACPSEYHAEVALEALAAGLHVLVEKPIATTLAAAEQVLAVAASAPGHLICAPHILLSPTYRAMHRRVAAGEIGGLLTARARYGWAGPDWGRWFYEPGGGALFDLGVYNVTSLCGFFGPARRVTAMTGVAIPERVVNGEPIRVEAEDNAHVLLDFGDARFAVVSTGFTMQRYRSPAIELYGTHGVVQLLGDDWAPEGYELWRNDTGAWQLYPEIDPAWPWTDGLRHLIGCIETGAEPVTRPEHAFHALEIMLAAQVAGRDGRARTIASDFPAPALERLGAPDGGAQRVHDPRSAS
jgi:predicted dehydrogenase